MASLVKNISDGYNYVIEDLADPRVKPYFLMNSPFPLACILCFYLAFVLKFGPNFMKDRKPFNLEKVLVGYNLVQIVACSYLIVIQISHTLFKYSIFCAPIDYSYDEDAVFITRHVWLYFMLKIVDLLDTVFFILRKKTNQITFLHVYHHTGMCILTWIATKYLAGGHSLMVGFLNNIVHMFMYFYYLLSAWDKEYKTNLWWKKYLTQLQIFILIVMYYTQLLFQPSCGYPTWTVWYFVPQNVLMIILFTNFYIKAYVKTPKQVKNGLVEATNGVNGHKAKSE